MKSLKYVHNKRNERNSIIPATISKPDWGKNAVITAPFKNFVFQKYMFFVFVYKRHVFLKTYTLL